MLARSLRASSSALALARTFKTKASEMAAKKAALASAEKANRGKDPYGLFKTAIMSEPEEDKTRGPWKQEHAEWKEHRANYSRAKMLEHHRVNAHFSMMIKARKQALAALPPELREEASAPDHTIIPIERRIFTETAPIPDFQDKLIRGETAAVVDS